jgi:CHAD domain-containing protein
VISADRWTDHLREHLDLARRPAEVEGVHQVRVAARRLDAWLLLGRRRMLRDDLRWLRGVVGEARDLDVLLARGEEFPAEFVAWLRERRAVEQLPVEAGLDSERTSATVAALLVLAPVEEALARRSIRGFFDRVSRGDAALASSGDQAEAIDARVHGLRRALRRLRFALDWMGEKVPVLAELQDRFGEACDQVVLMRWIDESPMANSLAGLRKRVETAKTKQREAALAAWAEARPEMEALKKAWN